MNSPSCAGLADGQVLELARKLVSLERRCAAELIACLVEISRRRLCQNAGFSGLFAYCIQELKLSPDQAFRRVRVCGAAARYPEVLAYLDDGSITLTAMSVLAPLLTRENRTSLLEWASRKSSREIERRVAELSPGHAKRSLIRSTAPGLVRISLTAAEELRGLIERARSLLWHRHPEGRLEDILLYIFHDFLRRSDRGIDPGARPVRPRRAAEGRRVPRWVRREVWRRDGGRCVFVSPAGYPCLEQRGLEFDHIKPWALGGPSDDPGNIRLLCRAHNVQEAGRVVHNSWGAQSGVENSQARAGCRGEVPVSGLRFGRGG